MSLSFSATKDSKKYSSVLVIFHILGTAGS